MAALQKRKPDAVSGARAAPPAPILDVSVSMENPHRKNAYQIDHLSDDIDVAAADYDAVLKFLFAYTGSSATFNAYRRDLERFLQWAWRIEARSVLTLTRNDIEDFIRFSSEPPLAWIGEKHAARTIKVDGARCANPDWRPYVASVSKTETKSGSKADKRQYQMSQSTLRALFSVLSSFYDFLTEEKQVEFNPVALIRQKSKFLRKDHNAPVVRRISNLQWDYVLETAEQLADQAPALHERTLFIMNCLFAMYLRVSELVADERSNPVMGDFRKDQDGNWWFHVTGKGNKDRTIVVSNAMIAALRRYRGHLGLSPLPVINEQTPLIAKAKGVGPVTSTRQIRRIVQDCFDAAFERMRSDGLEDDAHDLRAATVHWLRHTGISEDVKIRPREHVRDDAGHATMATTDRYIESDRRERHQSGKKKPLKDL